MKPLLRTLAAGLGLALAARGLATPIPRAELPLALPPALAAALAAAPAGPPTWEVSAPADGFVDRAGGGDQERLSRGEVGVVLPSFGRRPLYLAYRALTLDPAALAAGNEAAKAARAASVAADRRGKAIGAWAAERGVDLRKADWTEYGVYRSFAHGVLGGYVNCAPDAFRQALDTLAVLRADKAVGKADVEAWLAAQDAAFAFCADPPAAAAPAPVPVAAPAVPAPLPAKAPARLRQLRDYQIAAAHLYAGDEAKALAAFDAIAKVPGHPMRGWAALGAVRALVRSVTLELTWRRAVAEARAPGVAREDAERLLRDAHRKDTAARAQAAKEARARIAAVLASKELRPVHAAARSTLASALRNLVPREWWKETAADLARLEARSAEDDLLFQWAEITGAELEPWLPEDVAELRPRLAFLDWIATVQACTDNPGSPHARGGCDAEHAHAREAWARAPGAAWLVAALATARTLEPDDAPLLAAAAALPDEAPAARSARYHAARLLVAAGRRAEARPLVEKGVDAAKAGSPAWHLWQQLRLATETRLEALGPALARDAGRTRVALGADGRRLLNGGLATEDLLRLADAPATPRALAGELYLAAWFRADLLGKPALAEAAAAKVKATSPKLANAVDFYLGSPPERRHASLLLSALSTPVSPQVGWLRSPREPAWWCTFDAAAAAPQLQIERTPPPPALEGVADARAEAERLAALGPGTSYQVREVLKLVATLPFTKAQAKELLIGTSKALDGGACPNPDAPRLKEELQKALDAVR